MLSSPLDPRWYGPQMPDLTRDLGPGTVTISGEGAVAAVAHPTRAHSMLLEEDPAAPEAAMHDPSRRWGKGFVVTDRAARRFDQPASLSWSDDGVELVHDLGDLELSIGRRVADAWTESYQLRNVASYRVTIGSVAVSTPWRDVYGSSRESLRRAVHAHLWTGGADAWVWAVPMDGSGPGLGLTLTEGELWAYSVESRDTETGSNVRGHLYLHVTDHARASHAMGGQPQIRLDPGATYRWSWRLDWYDSLAAFHATRQPLLDADVLTAQVGESITLRLAPGATTSTPQPVAGSTAGIQHVVASDGRRRSRISLLFHPPLRELVEQRALGGDHYLAFGLGPLLGTLATRLTTAGRDDDATRMREHLQRHAGTFLAYGDDLPPHEVNYEQSMVAPLLELLVAAYGAAPGTVDGAVDGGELRRRLSWLTAFAADQPDARLRHIPIRHWDGYWFGRQRLWGDVFPHYWSVLSADVLLSWPDELADPATLERLRAAGWAILRANLANFRPDGSATCAFVYPSCVNGVPAHIADPLANDQDWALVYALRLGLGRTP